MVHVSCCGSRRETQELERPQKSSPRPKHQNQGLSQGEPKTGRNYFVHPTAFPPHIVIPLVPEYNPSTLCFCCPRVFDESGQAKDVASPTSCTTKNEI